ncbi:FxSxx-COOH system tetratricopeptide repeat protein [Acrocarpospora sp. B8E8]|uniref:FxSxx-COOH system tetratricopeptide repeat protein n=1 Tax=Acrocarpospora sp. B8E8 TaxID=3153572 RepID=UPI00325D7D4E
MTEPVPAKPAPQIIAGGAGAVAAGANSGVIATGDDATITQINQVTQIAQQIRLPEAATRPVADVPAPAGTINVPAAGQVFLGRREELDVLAATLENGPGGVVVAAVHGLGGVGKSALAAHYAATQVGRLNPIWWITADSPASVEAGLADLAVALQPELGGAPLEVLAQRALAWLAAHPGWLLIADNVTTPADADRLLARTLAGQGRVLVTSRLGQGWHRTGARLLRLDVLTEPDAIDLLIQIATYDQPPVGTTRAEASSAQESGRWEGASALVRELGWLPLAVEQAGAYLRQNQLTARAYLDLLAEHPAVMYDQAARGSDVERTIARSWRLTLDQLAATPLAGQVLRVLAWFAPQDIPRAVLNDLAPAPDLQRALGDLAAYNMLTLADAGISVHRLVQAVARTPGPADPHRQPADIDAARDQATALLAQALPDDGQDPAGWPQWRGLLDHLTALADHTSPSTDTINSAYLLSALGRFLYAQGSAAAAISHQQRAHMAYHRHLDADHPNTLSSRSNLAAAYRAAGDLGRAIPLFEQTLADCERVLGGDHPDTLASRNNLAGAYESAGDLGRAIPLFEQTLADCERVLDGHHPQTLTSRNNLAGAYESAGDLGRAIPLYEQTLAQRERLLGDDHPDTLTSRNNLAYAYRAAGDLGGAIPLYQQTLAERERVLGADHPDTLSSRNNLASAYESAGDLGRAIPLYQATLVEQERILGGDHPHTLTSRNNLAAAYESAGDLRRAIPLYEQTLAQRERLLGEDHPDTLTSRNNLAAAYESAGDLGRATPLFERTLAERERVLGNDHPHTLASRNNLAYAYQAAGDLGRAIPLYQQTLAERERVLGEDHPDTLASRNNLAAAYREARDLGRAIPEPGQ